MRAIRIAAWMWTASAAAFGQAPGEPLQFEVASVKAAAPPARAKSDYEEGYNAGARAALAAQGIRVRGDRVTITDNSLRDLIRLAYEVRDHQIEAPAWMAVEKYEIAARMPAGADRSQVPGMLRRLLEQRFRLQTHREKREMTVYALEATRDGAKLTAAPEGRRGSTSARAGRVIATSASLAAFAELLTKAEGRPVVDLTGIPGLFDMDLRYTPELGRTDAEGGPSLIAALREQLGLRLERRKLPVEVLVVERGDRVPTEN
jgi:uncharacterized protein (TIGR03435 family)